MQLSGRRVIVTGGARGIGAASVRAFAAEGATVASLDVLDDAGRQVAAEADEKGPGTARYRHCDIANRQQVDEAFDEVVTAFGGLDVLANIAGIEGMAPAAEITDEEWDRVFAVNVKGTLYTNQAAYRAMRGNPAGGPSRAMARASSPGSSSLSMGVSTRSGSQRSARQLGWFALGTGWCARARC
jgi:3-oxoacyl-[acyl-carrier protein] reductase